MNARTRASELRGKSRRIRSGTGTGRPRGGLAVVVRAAPHHRQPAGVPVEWTGDHRPAGTVAFTVRHSIAASALSRRRHPE
ncbi:hypothetical protein [Embleya sp. NPDC001921]